MRRVLVTPAGFEPLDLEMVKARPELRIAGPTDDAVIADMIRSAVEAYEEYTGNVLCLSTWDLYLDGFPGHHHHHPHDAIETPAPLAQISGDSPPVDVTSIAYLDGSGSSRMLPSSHYKLDMSSEVVGRIVLRHGQSWPHALHEANSVVVRFAVGYADADSIPRRIKDGLLLKIQELYYGGDLSASYQACWNKYRRIPV